MTSQKLQQLIRARPFRPFWLCIADGHQARVTHPECVAVSLDGRMATVFTRQGLEIIDLPLATGASFRRPDRPGRRRASNP